MHANEIIFVGKSNIFTVKRVILSFCRIIFALERIQILYLEKKRKKL
jgi:hypothetical protein